METAFLLLVFLVVPAGLLTGNAADLLIERIPAGRPVWLDFHPAARLSRGFGRHALVLLLNTAAYAALFLRLKATPAFLLAAAFSSGMLVNAFIDAEHRELSDKVNLFLLLPGLLSFAWPDGIPPADRLAGLLTTGLPLLLVLLASRNSMGLGDVKFAAACGLMLGMRRAVPGLLAACLGALIYGMIRGRMKTWQTDPSIPFAPFLAGGFFLALLVV